MSYTLFDTLCATFYLSIEIERYKEAARAHHNCLKDEDDPETSIYSHAPNTRDWIGTFAAAVCPAVLHFVQENIHLQHSSLVVGPRALEDVAGGCLQSDTIASILGGYALMAR